MTTRFLARAKVGARPRLARRASCVGLLCLVSVALAGTSAGPAVAQSPSAGAGNEAGSAVTEANGTAGHGQIADPTWSLPMPAAMAQACRSGSEAQCNAAALDAIDHARSLEKLPPLDLPGAFSQLSLPAQVLVVTDLERTDRGLPGFPGLSAELDRLASAGAEHMSDPSGPNGTAWGSNFAIGYSGALEADYAWMYDDGPGSPNSDCKAGVTSGCWGHRHNILGSYGPHPAMGAAVERTATGSRKVLVFTQLFAGCPAGLLDVKLPALQ